MAKGFGIAALVVIIISFIIPLIGTFVAYFALILAAIAALAGDKPFAIATAVIAGIKLFFLSPVLMGMMYAGENGVPGALPLTAVLTALPVALVIFRAPLVARFQKREY